MALLPELHSWAFCHRDNGNTSLRRSLPDEEWPCICMLSTGLGAGSQAGPRALDEGGWNLAWPPGWLTFLPLLVPVSTGFWIQGWGGETLVPERQVHGHVWSLNASPIFSSPDILCCLLWNNLLYYPPVCRFLFSVIQHCGSIACCPVTTFLLYIPLASLLCFAVSWLSREDTPTHTWWQMADYPIPLKVLLRNCYSEYPITVGYKKWFLKKWYIRKGTTIDKETKAFTALKLLQSSGDHSIKLWHIHKSSYILKECCKIWNERLNILQTREEERTRPVTVSHKCGECCITKKRRLL